MYKTTYIARGGAKIFSLEDELLELISGVPRQDIIVVYICAGICEITNKETHVGGTELSLYESTNVLEHLISFKYNIRRLHPRSVVGISTIPIVSLKQSQQYFKDSKQLFAPKFNQNDLEGLQKKLSDQIANINTSISQENRQVQDLPGVGCVIPPHFFMHQDIEKQTIRKSKSSRQVIKRIPEKKLIDGIHASDDVVNVWFNALHCNFHKVYTAVKSLLDK